ERPQIGHCIVLPEHRMGCLRIGEEILPHDLAWMGCSRRDQNRVCNRVWRHPACQASGREAQRCLTHAGVRLDRLRGALPGKTRLHETWFNERYMDIERP